MTVQRDFEKTTEELLLELSEQLLEAGEVRFSGPVTKAGKIQRATAWMDKTLLQLKISICTRPEVVAYLTDKDVQSRVDIAAVIVDCLANSKLPIPVGTFAVLVVKERLNTLCS